MLCALFKDCLVLACPVKIRESRSFQVVAVIQLADAKLERTDNAKGILAKELASLQLRSS